MRPHLLARGRRAPLRRGVPSSMPCVMRATTRARLLRVVAVEEEATAPAKGVHRTLARSAGTSLPARRWHPYRFAPLARPSVDTSTR